MALNEHRGISYLHTSHKPKSVASFAGVTGIMGVNNFRFSRYTLHMHSHKGGNPTPSTGPDQDIDNLSKTQNAARYLKSYIYTPNFRGSNRLYMYGNGNRKVKPYNNVKAYNLSNRFFN